MIVPCGLFSTKAEHRSVSLRLPSLGLSREIANIPGNLNRENVRADEIV